MDCAAVEGDVDLVIAAHGHRVAAGVGAVVVVLDEDVLGRRGRKEGCGVGGAERGGREGSGGRATGGPWTAHCQGLGGLRVACGGDLDLAAGTAVADALALLRGGAGEGD